MQNGWQQIKNFQMARGGLLWNADRVTLDVQSITPQTIHCKARCKETSISFHISLVYGLFTIVNRRQLWDTLKNLGVDSDQPWLVMGHFNSITSPDEKIYGAEVTGYETKDMLELALGLVDMASYGCFYTWTNNQVWCKLDRAMVNPGWLQADYFGQASF